MTVPQASMLTRAFVSLSPFSFSPFLSLPCQPQSLTAILLFFYLKKHLFSFPLCVSHSLGLPSPYVLSCLPLHLLSPLHVPPTHTLPISWFPQLLVRDRLRWLRSLRWMRCQPNVDPTVSSQSSTNGQHPAGLSYSTKSGDIYTP